MQDKFRGALAALAFLSRLAPGVLIEDEDLSRAMGWLPVVGGLLGLCCIGPLWLGLFGSHPFVQAWLGLLLLTYLTRALHLDGMADVCDGMAAHFDPARFWEITKDSLVGPFGVVGLVFLLLGQVLVMGELFALGQFGPVLWACIVGRMCGLGLGFAGKGLARPGLGALFLSGATRPALLLGFGFTLASGLLLASATQLFAALVAATLSQLPLLHLARRVNGLNGDFLGASIVTGELGALLGLLLAT